MLLLFQAKKGNTGQDFAITKTLLKSNKDNKGMIFMQFIRHFTSTNKNSKQ